MTHRCDVLVIGAGPAGSSSASLLQKAGLSTMVIEKQRFPRFVIGESLLPRCMDMLNEADLLDAVAARHYLVKRGALFVRGQERCDFDFSSQFTPGWNHTWQVPRADFDKTLADAVESRGVPFLYGHEVVGIDLDHGAKVTVRLSNGTDVLVQSRFVVDASGYGRTLPRLLGLDRPTTLPSRTAIYGHFRGDRRPDGPDTNRIWIVSFRTGAWGWIIPFSDGITSFGIVGSPEDIGRYHGDVATQLRQAIAEDPNCRPRLQSAELVFPPRSMTGYSCSVSQLYGRGYCLVGNATEFLDPVFSSGVTLALESANRASKCVIRELRGEPVDWDADYAGPMARGTDVFRTYVNEWYSGTLPTIFYAKTDVPVVKRMICSVLAGYVWDETNPFVAQHARKVAQTARLIASGAGVP